MAFLIISYSLSHYHFSDEDEVSSGSAELQQLTVDDQEASHEEDRPAVLIPNHLLIHTKECSQLSFGSFGSMTLSNNAEETPAVGQQVEHSDARYPITTDDISLSQNILWVSFLSLIFAEILSSMEMNNLEVEPMEIWATHLPLEVMMILWNLGRRF